MSADYSLALNRTKAGRASSPTRGAITNDPFPYAGPRERRMGREHLPSAIVMHQSGPVRADFRTSSTALARLSDAISVNAARSTPNSARRHHLFNSTYFRSIFAGGRVGRTHDIGRSAAPSILRTEK